MSHQVFISYSSVDRTVADEMCSVLESVGIRCWIAPRDILPGMDWGSSIIDAITASRVMVLILSANSNASVQVKREIERAVNKNVMVIPFRIENITLSKTLEYHLSVTHWMDALTPPMARHLQTLAEKLTQILSADPGHETVSSQPRSARPPATSNFPLRLALYLGGGLLLCLIIVVVLVSWFAFRPSSSTPEVTAESTPGGQPVRASISPTPLPSNQGNNTQDKPADTKSDSLRVPVINGTAYDVARELLIREGWQPHQKHISYGNDPNVQSGNGPIFWKKGYYELVSCAGSAMAECLFEFIDTNERVLLVVTQGEEAENGEYHAIVKRVTFKK